MTGRDTIRLTTAQALVKYLQVQYSERDGRRRRLIPAVFGIFGHGNVAGLGQALQEYGADLPYYQPCNEQSMVHTATGYARANHPLATLACTSSIGPGATKSVGNSFSIQCDLATSRTEKGETPESLEGGSMGCRGQQACDRGEGSVCGRNGLRRRWKSDARVVRRTAGGSAAQSSKTGTSSQEMESVEVRTGWAWVGERVARKASSLRAKSGGRGRALESLP